MGWKCITVSSIFIEHQFFNTVVINNDCDTQSELQNKGRGLQQNFAGKFNCQKFRYPQKSKFY